MNPVRPLTILALAALGFLRPSAEPRPLPRSTPESQGVSSEAILDFVNDADRSLDSLHSLMILRHGRVIAEGWWAPYDPRTRHELYSLSKSFTSTAVGFAVAEGKLSVDDELTKLFPAELPAEIPSNLRAMRLRDLLCMSAGHGVEIGTGPAAMTTRAFLAHPVPFKPGTRFLYNTPATFMLSASVQRATGQTVLEYLRPRLFDPLGIEDPSWDANVEGISLGGYGLSVRTEDIAKFGQLYLQKGKWDGRQILPESWVDFATSRQTSNGSNPKSDWEQGYGFQFWRCRQGAFRGDGAFGQFCVVMPAQDAVVVTTAGLKDMQAVLDRVWQHLLPAMKPGRLARNPKAQDALSRRLGSLHLPAVPGEPTTPDLWRWAGRRFVFSPNEQKLESLNLRDGGKEGMVLELHFEGREDAVVCGFQEWHPGRLKWGTQPERAVASSGAWTSSDTFEARVCFRETPYTLSLRLKFSDRGVRIEPFFNVFFGAAQQAELNGELR